MKGLYKLFLAQQNQPNNFFFKPNSQVHSNIPAPAARPGPIGLFLHGFPEQLAGLPQGQQQAKGDPQVPVTKAQSTKRPDPSPVYAGLLSLACLRPRAPCQQTQHQTTCCSANGSNPRAQQQQLPVNTKASSVAARPSLLTPTRQCGLHLMATLAIPKHFQKLRPYTACKIAYVLSRPCKSCPTSSQALHAVLFIQLASSLCHAKFERPSCPLDPSVGSNKKPLKY